MKRGKKYVEAAKLIDRATLYDRDEAIALVKKSATAKFDETIEYNGLWRNSIPNYGRLPVLPYADDTRAYSLSSTPIPVISRAKHRSSYHRLL